MGTKSFIDRESAEAWADTNDIDLDSYTADASYTTDAGERKSHKVEHERLYAVGTSWVVASDDIADDGTVATRSRPSGEVRAWDADATRNPNLDPTRPNNTVDPSVVIGDPTRAPGIFPGAVSPAPGSIQNDPPE